MLWLLLFSLQSFVELWLRQDGGNSGSQGPTVHLGTPLRGLNIKSYEYFYE